MLQWISMQIIFTARHYASAVYAVIVCLSACLSVCLSVRPYVRNEPLLFRNDWTNPACFCHWGFLPPVLHCITRKFGYLCISKNKGIFPRICIQKISPRQVDRVVSKTHDVWACWPHLRRSTRRGCARRGYHYLYYFDRNVRFIVDLSYSLFLHLCCQQSTRFRPTWASRVAELR